MATAYSHQNSLDWYAVLQVAPDASDEVIQGAYRALVKQHHPDHYRGQSSAQYAQERMKTINEAYHVLGDATHRARYDRERKWANDNPPPTPKQGGPVSRIFNRLFGKVPWWLWLLLWITLMPRMLRWMMVSTVGQIVLGLATVFVFWRLMPKVPVNRQ